MIRAVIDATTRTETEATGRSSALFDMRAGRKNKTTNHIAGNANLCDGFTLIELVVVIGIIALLIGVLVRVGGNAITSGRVSETRAVMETLNVAIEQFNSEAPFKGISYDALGATGQTRIYQDRYGNNPPDELEGFDQGDGIPGFQSNANTDRFFVNDPTSLEVDAASSALIENADIKAMTLAIKLHSPSATTILDKIPGRYRRTADKEFLDRDGVNTGAADPDDEVLTYFVDTWGTPLQYFALREVGADPQNPGSFMLQQAPSDPTMDRMITSTYLIQQNRGQPVLVSYGPDGPDQFSPDFAINNDNDAPDLIQDFAGNDGTTPSAIDNPLNADNVYLDPALSERIHQPGTN